MWLIAGVLLQRWTHGHARIWMRILRRHRRLRAAAVYLELRRFWLKFPFKPQLETWWWVMKRNVSPKLMPRWNLGISSTSVCVCSTYTSPEYKEVWQKKKMQELLDFPSDTTNPIPLTAKKKKDLNWIVMFVKFTLLRLHFENQTSPHFFSPPSSPFWDYILACHWISCK